VSPTRGDGRDRERSGERLRVEPSCRRDRAEPEDAGCHGEDQPAVSLPEGRLGRRLVDGTRRHAERGDRALDVRTRDRSAHVDRVVDGIDAERRHVRPPAECALDLARFRGAAEPFDGIAPARGRQHRCGRIHSR
jgi:hypothetical protein